MTGFEPCHSKELRFSRFHNFFVKIPMSLVQETMIRPTEPQPLCEDQIKMQNYSGRLIYYWLNYPRSQNNNSSNSQVFGLRPHTIAGMRGHIFFVGTCCVDGWIRGAANLGTVRLLQYISQIPMVSEQCCLHHLNYVFSDIYSSNSLTRGGTYVRTTKFVLDNQHSNYSCNG